MKKFKFLGVIVVIVLNVLLFSSLELIFRAFDIGNDVQLFTQLNVDDEEYLRLNGNFASKYFSNTNVTIPTPNSELFQKVKPENTYRIYVIGESTSRGFPYSKVESFPHQLKQMLNIAGVNKSIEVINFSMDATNSYTGVDVVNEIIKYPPDLAIIYYGHNEFIGIGGSGEHNNFLFKTNKYLSKYRIYQLFKKLLSREKKDTQLLENMSRKDRIDYDSDKYEQTINDFSSHYQQMIETLKSKNIDVLACGVVANLKGYKPANDVTLSKNELLELIRSDSLSFETKKMIIDSLAKLKGNVFHGAGQLFLKQNDIKTAKYCFKTACDYDNLRLRASSEINKIINELASNKSCGYINFQEIFDSVNSDGITGNSLLLEHVHPTLYGQNLMARKLADRILGNYLAKPQNENYSRIKIYRSIVDDLAVTRTLYNLFTKYPLADLNYFNIQGFLSVYKPDAKSTNELVFKNDSIENINRILQPYYQKYTSIELVHLNYATKLFNEKDLNKSYAEYSIAYAINPSNVQALTNMAVIRYIGGDKKTALEMQDWACKVNPEYLKGLKNYWKMLMNEKQHKEARIIKEQLEDLGGSVDLETSIMNN